jgi:hypothetical protein
MMPSPCANYENGTRAGQTKNLSQLQKIKDQDWSKKILYLVVPGGAARFKEGGVKYGDV